MIFKRHPLAAAVSSLALIAATPAFADCRQELQQLQEKATERDLSSAKQQSVEQQIERARTQLEAGDEANCMAMVQAARRTMEQDTRQAAAGSQSQSDDAIEVEAPPAQISVQQKPADVNVKEQPADVQVDLGQPVVEVERNDPKVNVDSKSPQVDVDVKDPTATARVEEPEVDVQTRRPDVDVESQKPEVSVRHPEADVSVEQEDPTVSIDQRQPEVAVEQQQPQIDMQASEPDVDVETAEADVNVQQAKPEVDVQTSGTRTEMAGTGQSAQSAASTDLASLEFREGTASVKVSDLEGYSLRDSSGANIGRVNEVVTRSGDGQKFLVLQPASGGESNLKLAPVEQLGANGQDQVRFEGQQNALSSYDPNSDQYERVEGSSTIEFQR